MYGTEVSATLISTVTDAVLDEVKHWLHILAQLEHSF
jgi:transposase-like protein